MPPFSSDSQLRSRAVLQNLPKRGLRITKKKKKKVHSSCTCCSGECDAAGKVQLGASHMTSYQGGAALLILLPPLPCHRLRRQRACAARGEHPRAAACERPRGGHLECLCHRGLHDGQGVPRPRARPCARAAPRGSARPGGRAWSPSTFRERLVRISEMKTDTVISIF